MTKDNIHQSFFKKFISPIQIFIQDSRSVGITLIVCTIISLIISNSAWSDGYTSFWHHDILPAIQGLHLPLSPEVFINDALMAVFFLLVGMEIKRELMIGELSNLKKATLPIFAALGGMVVPALFYFSWNTQSDFTHGWGIAMATDIAFALGVLSLLGNKVPFTLKVLLAALAIIDDLGAIIAIAIFYTDELNWLFLGIAGLLFSVLILLNKLKVNNLIPYLLVGILLWYCMLNSGVHATLAGVLLAMTIPLKKIPAIEHVISTPVNFIVLPLFALANTAIIFPHDLHTTLDSPINHGILMGLMLGKPIGIALISFIVVKIGLGQLPKGIKWKHILGIGFLGGIGFTMSIFISMLAFNDAEAQTVAKLSVLIASTLSALIGYFYLRTLSKKQTVA